MISIVIFIILNFFFFILQKDNFESYVKGAYVNKTMRQLFGDGIFASDG
jgi:hypothetical protein